jgi:hypothetical protein
MEQLAKKITEILQTAPHCAIYEADLKRVWAPCRKDREREISRFAKAHGWRLGFYRTGLCAIFDHPPPGGANKPRTWRPVENKSKNILF